MRLSRSVSTPSACASRRVGAATSQFTALSGRGGNSLAHRCRVSTLHRRRTVVGATRRRRVRDVALKRPSRGVTCRGPPGSEGSAGAYIYIYIYIYSTHIHIHMHIYIYIYIYIYIWPKDDARRGAALRPRRPSTGRLAERPKSARDAGRGVGGKIQSSI